MSLNIRDLFSVNNILRSRGYSIDVEGDGSDIILSNFTWPSDKADLVFDVFDDTESRSQLLSYIAGKPRTISTAKANILINHPDFSINPDDPARNFDLDRNKFSTTFEWYVGELLVRKFGAFSASYGIKFLTLPSEEFDVLAVLRNTNLVYIECKTGKKSFKRNPIEKCIDRGLKLHCEFCVIIYMERIDETALKQCLNTEDAPFGNANTKLHSICINNDSERESKILEWHNCFFITASRNVEAQLSTVLRFIAAKKTVELYLCSYGNEVYERIGFQYEYL
jgi:hypothetical protein